RGADRRAGRDRVEHGADGPDTRQGARVRAAQVDRPYHPWTGAAADRVAAHRETSRRSARDAALAVARGARGASCVVRADPCDSAQRLVVQLGGECAAGLVRLVRRAQPDAWARSGVEAARAVAAPDAVLDSGGAAGAARRRGLVASLPAAR